MQTVQLPNGQKLQFPEGTSQEVMSASIAKNFPEFAPKQAQASIAEDIGSTLKNAPNALIDALKALPEGVLGAGKTLVTNPNRAALNIGVSLSEALRGAGNAIPNTLNYFRSKGLNIPEIPTIKPWEALERGHEELGELNAGDRFIQGITELLPALKAAKLANAASKIGASGEVAAAAAANAVGANRNPLEAALVGGGIQGLASGIGAAIPKLNPLNTLGKNITTPELEANLRAAEGTNAPLGRVIESPTLNAIFEKYLPEIPFAGIKSNRLQPLKNQIESKAENIITETAPKQFTGDTNDLVQSLIQESATKQKSIKNKMYQDVTKLSEAEKHRIELSTAKELAQNTKEIIEGSPLYQTNPQFKSLYNKVLGIGESKNPTFTEVNTVADELYNAGEKFKKSITAGDKYVGGLYQNLAKRLRNDVKTSLKETGSPELQEAYTAALKNYKENYVPFLDKEISDIVRNEEPDALVREIIQPGKKADRYRDITKVQAILPKEHQNLLGHTFLKAIEDKEGNIDPKALAAQINSLGIRQFKALFPSKELQQKLLDYGRLRGMSEKALNVMFNPETGAKNTQVLLSALIAELATGSGGLAAGLGTTAAAARLAGKVLTSPKIRETLVKKMIAKKTKAAEEPSMTLLKQALRTKKVAPASVAVNREKENQ